jgi:hypothetical protein
VKWEPEPAGRYAALERSDVSGQITVLLAAPITGLGRLRAQASAQELDFRQCGTKMIVTFAISKMWSEAELAGALPHEVLDKIFVGELVFPQSELKLGVLPLVSSVSTLNTAVHNALFYTDRQLVNLGLGDGITFWMSRSASRVVFELAGAQFDFDGCELAGALGQCLKNLVEEIRMRRPQTYARNEVFLSDSELRLAWIA